MNRFFSFIRPLFALSLIAGFSSASFAQDTDTMIRIPNSQIGTLYKTSSLKRVAVHDPSIASYTTNAGNRYHYVFGSHLGVAYSTDLKNWTAKYWASSCRGLFGRINDAGKIESLANYTNAYHENQTKQVKILVNGDTVDVDFGDYDASEWNTSSGQDLGGVMWAPDVVYNPYLGKWCMYMSLNGDDWRSVIVLLTSTAISGPYVYQGPVVFSGFQWTSIAEASWKLTDLELVLGELYYLPSRYNMGSSWGNRWPNVIDPCVFFDEDSIMRMAYGSWSGGIYMLQLDRNTGLRDYTVSYAGVNNNNNNVSSDPYFGKRIAGGYYVSGEGAYIQHIGDYYYLFITYGGLTADGGYEMHIFRSKNPDGPYTDTNGVSAVFTSYQMNYGTNAATTRGEKIIGAYQWDNMSTAELSQGHNSAFVDDDGNAYIVYHTRFNDGTEGHAVRVHQLFVNEDGWLVAAPFEYADSDINMDTIANKSCCTPQEIEGAYQVFTHKYKMDYANKAYQTPFDIYLHADGTISGDYSGTWVMTEGTSYFTITLKSLNSSTKWTYKGVILPQTVSSTNMSSICFTAANTSGVNIWGCNADGKLAVDYNYQKYTAPIRSSQLITGDIDLTADTYYGATITWASDREDLISSTGQVNIPTNDSTISVKMTYTIAKGNYYFDKVITVRVKGDGTGIDTPLQDALNGEEVIYNLQGNRVGSITQPGVYIINGKKRYVK